MPDVSVSADLRIGILPPANPTPATRWISQSAAHVQVPHTPFARTPIFGSELNGGAVQEISPWYNPFLNRYECLTNQAGSQYFSVADSPLGPWSAGVKVLGSGSGGEGSNAQQASVLVEGDQIYCYYITNINATLLRMAVATMPRKAGDLPGFAVLGTIYNPGVALGDSSWIVKADGRYFLFTYNGATTPVIAATGAADPSQFVAKPFANVSGTARGLAYNMGARYVLHPLRPNVHYEQGQWVLFAHTVGTDDGMSVICRWVSQDAGVPVNWTPDAHKFCEQQHPAEIDQLADFRLLRGPNDKLWAFWTGISNRAGTFTVFCAPVLEPMLAFDGLSWGYSGDYLPNDGAGQGYVNPDMITGDKTLKNLWDACFRTDGGSCTATFPVAGPHAKVKVTNAPNNWNAGNVVKLAPDSGADVICGGNPIAALSAVGTTVTVTTRRPHGLSIADFVTVTGAAPVAYNVNGAAVTGVPAANQFTYTAGSAPGAATTLGAYDSALQVGESRQYKARVPGVWVRD